MAVNKFAPLSIIPDIATSAEATLMAANLRALGFYVAIRFSWEQRTFALHIYDPN